MINLRKIQFLFTVALATSFSALFAGEVELKKTASNRNRATENIVTQLPLDPQTTIASYADPLDYEWWATLDTPADQVAFRDNGQYLVSVFDPEYWIWSEDLKKSVKNPVNTDVATLTVRNMKTGALLEDFPVSRQGVLSADGSRFLGQTGFWNTHTGEFFQAYNPINNGLSTNNDGSVVAINPLYPIHSLFGATRWPEIEILPIKSNNYWENRKTTLHGSNHEDVFLVPGSNEICITKQRRYEEEDTEGSITFNIWNTTTGQIRETLKFSREEMDTPKSVEAENNAAAYDNYSPNKKKLGKLFFPWANSPDSIRLQRLATERIINFPTPKKVILSEDGSLLVTQTIAPEPNSPRYYKTVYVDRAVENGGIWHQEIKGDYTSFALSPDNKLLALATKQNIQLWKQSTVLGALNKKQKIEKLRSEKSRKLSNVSSSSSSASSSSSSPAARSPQTAAPVNVPSAYGLAGIARYRLATDRASVARTLGLDTTFKNPDKKKL